MKYIKKEECINTYHKLKVLQMQKNMTSNFNDDEKKRM